MELLILFFALAVGVSFICSILESVLLSINMSYIAVLEESKPKAGAIMKYLKQNINKSIASILIINTIANTLGAAAVGAQAEVVFGSHYVFYISVVLTFMILFFSEIIPKTVGAIFYKELAAVAAYFIRAFVFITYPIILTTLFVTDKISKNKKAGDALSKDELIHSTLISENEGVIDEQESDVIENVLQMDDVKAKDILTPRSVMFSLSEDMKISECIKYEQLFSFSRIPVYKGGIDHITGLVLTKKIFEQALIDDTKLIKDIKMEIFTINENLPASKALNQFIKRKEHMFLVVDSYEQTEGIITLEDCIETLLGVEIMDESDDIEDMRLFAKQKV
ncbi:MAG: CNNM domain-containing protein, partial [Campylobacterota bacterium]